MAMKTRIGGMTAGLAIGITLAVAGACAAAAYLYSQRHFQTLLDGARGTAVAQAELIRAALEHDMIEQDRSLIARMIRTFASEPGVASVMLLDRTGVVRYSSGPVASGYEFDLQAPTCQACHQYPPAQRMSSRVIETGGSDILRTVVPFRNRQECHGCHDPAQKINGIVIFDVDASGMRAAANRDLRWMVGTTAGVALALVAAIALVVRVVVLRRLQRFEATARLIAEGDLDRRVPASGSDTISWLGREFNVMADSVTGLLGEVRSQRQRLETVINSIGDGIVVLDATRTVIAANDAFIARMGRARRDMLGCSCATTPSGICGVGDCPTLACLESGERQVRICERQRSDGTVAWEEVHACRIAGDADNGVQIVEVWRDITDRRAAEARLAESHRLASLGMLASGFSHEMNTPLATVLTCVEGIAREVRREGAPVDLSRVVEHASIAREQLLRCRGITQHFLRMSRGQPSQGQVVDVGAALAAVVSLVEPTARDHGVTMDVGPIGPGPLLVRADESDLQQALINLLLNAVQASTRGGTVTLRVSGRDAVTILIADEGCGIAPDQQARIFEPFFSLRGGGTGLGLFVSLNSVRKWGGDILVRSAPGEGATFEVVLPVLTGAAPGQAARA
jgi:PAS domain S-box-containing protein